MGETLKLLRIFYGYKVAQLAESLGFSQSYVSELENNRKQPTMDVLERYSKFFNMKISTIFLFAEALESDHEIKDKKQKVAYAGMKLLTILKKAGELEDE